MSVHMPGDRSGMSWLVWTCWMLVWLLGWAGQTQGMWQCDQGTCSSSSLFNHMAANGSRTALLQLLLRDYDNLMRPEFEEGKATLVTCDVFINSFDSISVDTMDFSVNIYMRQSWLDTRLAYEDRIQFTNFTRLALDNKLFDQIWVPDVFFPNEKESHQHCVTVPNRLIRIYPNGTVLYSARYTLRLSCHMNLQQFPLDEQECKMRIESYGYTMDELELVWRSVSAVQINDNLELPQFDLVGHSTGSCTQSYITGDFACLEIRFQLVRQYGYFMIQTYVPSILIVSLSWVSFWINIDAVPARISLGVLTVLTLTTQCVGVWMSLPRVSYIKAIDLWMSTCVIFVFAAMLEFAIVNTLSRKEIRKMSIRAKADGNAGNDVIKQMMDEYTYGSPKRFDPGSRMLARKVDKVSRKLFPLSFVTFNIIYWCVYLLR